ncbi:MAG TPA: hypothetical protein DIV36_00775 [Verrucomicrobiales bacterium]|nr:hypothetical protein [Verrucomicrobiales bacterium]
MLYGRQAIKVMDLRWEATAFKDRKKAPKTRGHNKCAKSSGPNSKKGGPLMTIKKLLQGSIPPGLRSRVEFGDESPYSGRYRMQALSKGHLPT